MMLAGTDVEIRTASIHDIARVAAALGEAFVDDPVMIWAIPEPDRRRAILPGFFTIFTAVFQRHGHVYRTTDGTAAALWSPPGVDAVGEDEGEEALITVLAILKNLDPMESLLDRMRRIHDCPDAALMSTTILTAPH